MAHYAFLDENNTVVSVITAPDEIDGESNLEDFYLNLKGQTCKKTSYNTHNGVHYDPNTGQPSSDQTKAFRKNYAGVGYTYDAVRDAFIPPKPLPSWVLNETTCNWEPPIPKPEDTETTYYYWDENIVNWVADTKPELPNP
jgi:hypothetical protein